MCMRVRMCMCVYVCLAFDKVVFTIFTVHTLDVNGFLMCIVHGMANSDKTVGNARQSVHDKI